MGKVVSTHTYYDCSPVVMWTWGHVHTKFWQPPQPYFNHGGQIMPTLYWCPHQVLKATGAPGL